MKNLNESKLKIFREPEIKFQLLEKKQKKLQVPQRKLNITSEHLNLIELGQVDNSKTYSIDWFYKSIC